MRGPKNRLEASAMPAPAPYASDPTLTRGRLYPEDETTARGPRDAFQRDRDRIVHSISFRRLRHKTQVFLAPDGAHFRVRLTHSIEVAQIGRTIARALGLNEDLTDALCLAHDIGHPPFGHAGEDALKDALSGQGGFDHNGNTLRALTEIDSPYPRFPGLNLTWETLEGLAKHNGPVAAPQWALAAADEAFALELGTFASLEAQVAAIADDIAYDNHDIDDGLRAGLLSLDQLLAVPMVAARWDQCRARFPEVAPDRLAGELIRGQIGAMVNDLIDTSRRAITDSGIQSPDDARDAGRALVGFSDAMRDDERALKRFLYANLYHHHPKLMPDEWSARLPVEEPWSSRHIADFIAGMTDRYAITRYREVVGPIELPEGF